VERVTALEKQAHPLRVAARDLLVDMALKLESSIDEAPRALGCGNSAKGCREASGMVKNDGAGQASVAVHFKGSLDDAGRALLAQQHSGLLLSRKRSREDDGSPLAQNAVASRATKVSEMRARLALMLWQNTIAHRVTWPSSVAATPAAATPAAVDAATPAAADDANDDDEADGYARVDLLDASDASGTWAGARISYTCSDNPDEVEFGYKTLNEHQGQVGKACSS
jgi:hypothetical protein